MANRSFVVQYIIRAVDQYSQVARQIQRAFGNIRRSAQRLNASLSAGNALTPMLRDAGLLNIRFRRTVDQVQAMRDDFDQMARDMRSMRNNAAGIHVPGVRPPGSGAPVPGVHPPGGQRPMERMTGMALGARALGAAVLLPAGRIATALKNAARDGEETRSKFEAVYRDIRAESDATATALARDYGMTKTAAQDVLSSTGDLLTGFGFSQKEALKMSNAVNQLAVDLASFQNLEGGSARASEALTKALLGEREQAKMLGIAILEEDVKARIRKLLMEGMTFESVRQAKAIATLQLAMEQSKNAIGDYARTREQLANQERETKARVDDLVGSYGLLLIPTFLKANHRIQQMAVFFTNLHPAIKKVIIAVGTLVLVVAPMLLLIGLLGAAIPFLVTGFGYLVTAFAAVKAAILAIITVITGLSAPIAIAIGAFAVGAFLVIQHWTRVKTFLMGIWTGLTEPLMPAITQIKSIFTDLWTTLSSMVDLSGLKAVADLIVKLFGKGSPTEEALRNTENIARLIGGIIGDTISLLIRGLAGIGAIVGQLVAAIVNRDFSQFDFGAIKAQFLGETSTTPAAAVDVNVNVGLAPGLQTEGQPQVQNNGTRRTDVGVLQ